MTEKSSFTIETSGEQSFGPCECCGQMTLRVWGFVYENDAAAAAYFVEWTPGHESNYAAYDLIIGAWGEESDNSQRQAVSLGFRRLDTGPAFMVVDSNDRNVATSPLISKALNREEVIGTRIATRAFAISDAIYLQEPRLSTLRA